MHLSKVAPILGLTVSAASAESDSACGEVPTIYMTVTGSPVTETFTVTAEAPTLTVNMESSSTYVSVNIDTSAVITGTSTSYETFTKIISIVDAGPTSAAAHQGPYYFTANNGITSWLDDESPSGTDGLVTSTTSVMVQPMPTDSQNSNGRDTQTTTEQTTSFSTLFLTMVHTKTMTESVSTAQASGKIFNGLASGGWNTTYVPMQQFKVFETGTGLVKQMQYQTGNADKFTHLPKKAKLSAAPSPYHNASMYLKPRQVISATVEGVIVSWTNSYDGSFAKASASIPVSSMAAPVSTSMGPEVSTYSWELTFSSDAASRTSSVMFTSVSASETISSGGSNQLSRSPETRADDYQATPTLSAPIYPWNLSSSNIPVFSKTLATESATSPWSSEDGPPTSTNASNPFGPNQIQPGIPKIQPSLSSAMLPVNDPTATPSFCNSAADFTISFDDLPSFDNGPNLTEIPHILNPYRKLYWAAGFTYAPPTGDYHYPPISPLNVALYELDPVNPESSPDAGLEAPGAFGAGPRFEDSAYWIDAHSAWLGCGDFPQTNCIMTIHGFMSTNSLPHVTQTVSVPACPGSPVSSVACRLTLVEFTDEFRGLSSIQILAQVGGVSKDWYMDNLKLAWSNNTCAAQLARSSAQ